MLICIYFLIFELFRWGFILSTSSRISSQHPLRKQTASSPGSLIINSTPAIFDTAQRFALSSKPLVLWSEWLCWSWDQTSAKLDSSSEHTFHQHIATLGRLTLLHHCSLMLLNCKERSEKKHTSSMSPFWGCWCTFKETGKQGAQRGSKCCLSFVAPAKARVALQSRGGLGIVATLSGGNFFACGDCPRLFGALMSLALRSDRKRS